MMSWKESKLDYIESFYGDAYKQFKADDAHDDRRVYINTYEMIVKAIGSLRKEPDLYVKVAIDEAIRKDFEMMRDIGQRFGRTDYIFAKEER